MASAPSDATSLSGTAAAAFARSRPHIRRRSRLPCLRRCGATTVPVHATTGHVTMPAQCLSRPASSPPPSRLSCQCRRWATTIAARHRRSRHNARYNVLLAPPRYRRRCSHLLCLCRRRAMTISALPSTPMTTARTHVTTTYNHWPPPHLSLTISTYDHDARACHHHHHNY